MNYNNFKLLKIIVIITIYFHYGVCLTSSTPKLLQKLSPPIHTGDCPSPEYSLEQCAFMSFTPSTCTWDYECDEDKKCCSNGCVMNCAFPQSPDVTKPGICPDTSMYPSAVGCDSTCIDDSNCPDTQKCCQDACGGTNCMEPAIAVKNGTCPLPVYTSNICYLLDFKPCRDDSSCYGDMKCCFNGCGKSCVEKMRIIKNGTCPAPIYTSDMCPYVKFATCKEDLNCEGTLKCCVNGCGKACTAPFIKSGICVDSFLTLSQCSSYNQSICKNDTNCPGSMKCCNTGCGNTCLAIKDTKPGGCPLPFLNQTQCMEAEFDSCENDSNCSGVMKCCNNGCGLACEVPLISKPGMCKTYNSDIQCLINACSNDWDCSRNRLCCDNGCNCVSPTF